MFQIMPTARKLPIRDILTGPPKLHVMCCHCRYTVTHPVGWFIQFGLDTSLSDIEPRLRCSRCGGRGAEVFTATPNADVACTVQNLRRR